MERLFLFKDQSQLVDHDTINSLSQPDRVVAFYKSLGGKSFNDVRNTLVNDFEGFSPESQRDFVLCIRSRDDYGQLELLKLFDIYSNDSIFNEYGTYLIPPLGNSGDVETGEGCTYLVSAPDWHHAVEDLRKGKFGRATVLLPELIITADSPIENIFEMEEISKIRIQEAKSISKENPFTTFIVGTPHFQANNDTPYGRDDEKPFNAAYVFQNGERKLVATKQFQFVSEEYFKFHGLGEHRKASKLDDSSAVIMSSDLIGLSGNRKFLDQMVKELFVISCFGIPANTRGIPQDPDQATQYFLKELKQTCQWVFDTNPNLNRILNVDRVSHSERSKKGHYANKPLNRVSFNPSGISIR